jgi:RNA polymerase sigma factor (sigma-70 family)
MEVRVIDLLAKRHKDWLNMARSFGLSKNDANEIVQQMYIRMVDYVTDIEKIKYNKDDVNTFYVYVTLRNLYLSGFHKIDKRLVYTENFSNSSAYDKAVVDFDPKEKELFDELMEKIEAQVDDWYWYDKRIFNIHFYDEMSMRKIAKETRISLSSIFNTLSNGKAKIKESLIKEYEKYIGTRS